MNTSLISKYFWGFSKKAVKEAAEIINNPEHRRFVERMVALLSRCDKPNELFSLISKDRFIDAWPRIRSGWYKYSQQAEFKAWWETIYEQLLEEYKGKIKTPKGHLPDLFAKIGKKIREKRIEKGFSQNELALKASIEQPDISMIEKGQKNITLYTLARICKVLEIDTIQME